MSLHETPIEVLRTALLAALPPPSEARRLFHGRGRRWPGLEHVTVDWLEGVVLVSLFRDPGGEGLAALRAMLDELASTPAWTAAGVRSLLLHHRYSPDSHTDVLHGEAVSEWSIQEDGLRYRLDLGVRQNMGLFLDMRNGRHWVRQQAEGRHVLNLFAYTCGFSVAALAGGASGVINLDMSRAALSRGRDNHRLNGHDLTRVGFLGHELSKSWGKVRKSGPYDLIITDPPTLQKDSFDLARDYGKVLRRLPEMLTPGGLVLACLNDPASTPDFLLRTVAEAAPQLRFRERLDNPPEFADIDPDSALKVLVFELT